MNARGMSMYHWIEAFRASLAPQIEQIHPSAQCICHEYFSKMHRAADASDTDELARLIALTQNKIMDELFWEEEKRRNAADPHYRVRYMRPAHG
jgi:hypothetical protein